MIKDNKAQGISLTTLVIAAICLIVLIILIFIFYKGVHGFNRDTKTCSSMNGIKKGDYGFSSCNGPVVKAADTDECCIPIIDED